jgi:hypothetical protein
MSLQAEGFDLVPELHKPCLACRCADDRVGGQDVMLPIQWLAVGVMNGFSMGQNCRVDEG